MFSLLYWEVGYRNEKSHNHKTVIEKNKLQQTNLLR
jgi:hypothetical protein